MKTITGWKQKTVIAHTADEYDQQMNELFSLSIKEPIIYDRDFKDGFCSTVRYFTSKNIPECIADEYELKGIRYYCADCIYCEPPLNMDGSVDKRKKWYTCSHYCKETPVTGCACNFLYEMLDAKQKILKGQNDD